METRLRLIGQIWPQWRRLMVGKSHGDFNAQLYSPPRRLPLHVDMTLPLILHGAKQKTRFSAFIMLSVCVCVCVCLKQQSRIEKTHTCLPQKKKEN